MELSNTLLWNSSQNTEQNVSYPHAIYILFSEGPWHRIEFQEGNRHLGTKFIRCRKTNYPLWLLCKVHFLQARKVIDFWTFCLLFCRQHPSEMQVLRCAHALWATLTKKISCNHAIDTDRRKYISRSTCSRSEPEIWHFAEEHNDENSVCDAKKFTHDIERFYFRQFTGRIKFAAPGDKYFNQVSQILSTLLW